MSSTLFDSIKYWLRGSSAKILLCCYVRKDILICDPHEIAHFYATIAQAFYVEADLLL